jgi:hypothetical protein
LISASRQKNCPAVSSINPCQSSELALTISGESGKKHEQSMK